MTQTPNVGAGGPPAAQGSKPSAAKHTAKFSGGTVVERRISVKDFKTAGVEGVEEDVVFNRANKHTVDVSGLPEKARELLANQPNIKISSSGE